MKRMIFIALCLMLSIESYAQKIKVACVGNSITYGAGINNNQLNSYPSQLQALLGEEYEVKNFGVSATTVLSNGNQAYIKTQQYKESLAYNPDIVFIKMGTNAAANRNVNQRHLFPEEYRKFVDTYRNLPSKPRVILMTPVRSFFEKDHPDAVISNEMIPVITQTANERGLDIINLHNLFGDKWEQYLMPDRLHPSAIGAGRIAMKMYKYLTLETASDVDIISNFALKPSREFNFHGFKGYEYDNNGVKYYIVKPYHTAVGNPWIWRARFWGHEPQTDIELLEQGFHLTYCEVGDLFGNQEAINRWDEFYKLATKAGLSKKVVLEGMSRGGLIVYNWSARNTDKVACIYVDAPVMDIKSWPVGYGTKDGNDRNIEAMMKAYGFTSNEQVEAWAQNPIDHAKKMAKSKIPMLHVVGDADTGVPVAENTAVFEERLAKYGYKLNVIHKPGVGHHPHSLNNPEPIVNFILEELGRKKNMCAYPAPGNEYRMAAGWQKGTEWHAIANDIETTLEGKELKVLLLGNSITQGFGGNRTKITSYQGKAAMDQAVGINLWESAGISGDRTQNLLWRLKKGNYNRCKPENVVITIGINNVTAGDKAEDIAQGIIACALEAKAQMPQAKIILFGLLPAGLEKNSYNRVACDKIHSILAKTKLKGVEYINPTTWFVNGDGSLKKELYAGDYLHLSAEGYKLWSEKIAKIISE